jgi:hypothetical protein
VGQFVGPQHDDGHHGNDKELSWVEIEHADQASPKAWAGRVRAPSAVMPSGHGSGTRSFKRGGLMLITAPIRFGGSDRMGIRPALCSEYLVANKMPSLVGDHLDRFVTASRPEEKERHMLGEIFGVDGIVVIAVLAVVLFGGAAIPKLARNLGSAKHQFEKGLEEGKKAVSIPSVATGTAPAPAGTPAQEGSPGSS